MQTCGFVSSSCKKVAGKTEEKKYGLQVCNSAQLGRRCAHTHSDAGKNLMHGRQAVGAHKASELVLYRDDVGNPRGYSALLSRGAWRATRCRIFNREDACRK